MIDQSRRPLAGLDQTTQQPAWSRGSKGSGSSDHLLVSLTILCHPDLERIGETVTLAELRPGHSVALSRTEPSFSPPGAAWDTRPLGDPFLSRRPWQLASDGSCIELSRSGSTVEVEADGEKVAETANFTAAALQKGVILVLARRITLLLHRILDPSRQITGLHVDSTRHMIGASERLAGVREAIARVADLDVPVLLRGESGTGKELAARALHERGRRAAHPFVAVNLGALSPALAASELFGHAKGAFTGAVTAREGYFRAAEGGTLFLDEVGESSGEVQAMLLRALENNEVVPVGSHKPRKIDIRLVAATDADLEERARLGDFKEPLLHRLSAYEIPLPALRDRREDIGRLFLHFAREALDNLKAAGHTTQRAPTSTSSIPVDKQDSDAAPWLSAKLMARLAGYTWPGNVRQLRNIVKQIVIDSRGRSSLHMGARLETLLAETCREKESMGIDVEERVRGGLQCEPAPAKHLPPAMSTQDPRRPAEVSDLELENAMRACRYEPATAARHLGISRPSIYNLIRRHPTLRTAEDLSKDELKSAIANLDMAGDVGEAAEKLQVSARALTRRLARRS